MRHPRPKERGWRNCFCENQPVGTHFAGAKNVSVTSGRCYGTASRRFGARTRTKMGTRVMTGRDDTRNGNRGCGRNDQAEQRDGQLPGRCPGYGNRQKYPRPTNGGRRKELRTRKRKCRKSMGQPFGENLGQYRVPQPHARNESKREKHLRHVTYLEVHKKGFQTMTQRITDA